MKNKIRNFWKNICVFFGAVRRDYLQITNKKCPHCGSNLYVEKHLNEYPYVCIKCDENFYSIEAVN